MEMTVLSPGLLTTVQDLGRPGHRRQGVASGGAMDPFALQVANLLVGNAANAPALVIPLRTWPQRGLLRIVGSRITTESVELLA